MERTFSIHSRDITDTSVYILACRGDDACTASKLRLGLRAPRQNTLAEHGRHEGGRSLGGRSLGGQGKADVHRAHYSCPVDTHPP